MDNYQTGNGPQQISLTVDISTMGLAATRAFDTKPNGSFVAVAQSSNASGDLRSQPIGSANSIGGSLLTVKTLIDLRIIGTKTERQNAFASIRASYMVDGGMDARQLYNQPDQIIPSSDYSIVVLIKQINLIQ